MTRLYRLKLEAQDACRFRGHKLGAFKHLGEVRKYAMAECVKCGAWVQVCDAPMPNEIDIGGPAVAVSCEGKMRPWEDDD